MQQNHIGLKITELRTQLGLTQEELASKCNINVRTIQRIEKGEVKPRAYTLKILSTTLGYDLLNTGIKSETSDNGWIIGLYSSCLIVAFFPYGIIISIIAVSFLWQTKKGESETLYLHGKNVINFQIVMLVFSLFLFAFLLYPINIAMVKHPDISVGNTMMNFANYYMKAYVIYVTVNVFFGVVNIILFLLSRKPFRLAPNFVK